MPLEELSGCQLYEGQQTTIRVTQDTNSFPIHYAATGTWSSADEKYLVATSDQILDQMGVTASGVCKLSTEESRGGHALVDLPWARMPCIEGTDLATL